MPTRVKAAKKLRLEIAEIAAKLIAIDGVGDYHAAKKKAAIQLGRPANKNLPSNLEIEQALVSYQNLFHPQTQAAQLRSLRLLAIQAMKLMRQFRPLLVGPVATGTATSCTEIVLHLHTDQIERVGLFLSEQGIPSTMCEKDIRINSTKSIMSPAYRFIADNTSILLVIFSEKDKNLNPLSSIDSKTMLMIGLQELIQMVEESHDSTRN